MVERSRKVPTPRDVQDQLHRDIHPDASTSEAGTSRPEHEELPKEVEEDLGEVALTAESVDRQGSLSPEGQEALARLMKAYEIEDGHQQTTEPLSEEGQAALQRLEAAYGLGDQAHRANQAELPSAHEEQRTDNRVFEHQMNGGRDAVLERLAGAPDAAQSETVQEFVGDDEQAKKDWEAYLASRDYADRNGNLHDAESGKFISSQDSVRLEVPQQPGEGNAHEVEVSDHPTTEPLSEEGQAALQRLEAADGLGDEMHSANETDGEPIEQPPGTLGQEIPPVDHDGQPLNSQSVDGVRNDEKIQLVVGGLVDGVERQSARDIGQREYDDMMAKDGNILRKMVRKVWRGRWAGRYYLRKMEGTAAREISATGRLDGMSAEQWQQFTSESIQRVLEDEGTKELMDTAAGEQREVLQGEKGERLKGLVDGLIKQYADGTLDKANLEEEARRQFATMVSRHEDMAEIIGAGNVYISNIASIAETVKSQVTHERGIDEVLARVELVTAKLSTGVNAEYKKTRLDKFLDKVPINSEYLAIALSGAWGFAEQGARIAASSLTRLGTISFANGVFTYMDEKRRMTKERVQLEREKAYGEGGDVQRTRRGEILAGTLQEMQRADVMTDALKSLAGEGGKYEVSDQAQFDAMLVAVQDISARMDYAGRTGGDQIQFSSREKAQGERRAMLVERFKAKAALRKHYEAQLAADPNFAGGLDFDTFMSQGQEAAEQGLAAHTDERNEDSVSKIRQQAVKAAAVSSLSGVLLGGFVHEGESFLTDHLQGAVEAIRGTDVGARAETVLASVVNVIREHTGHEVSLGTSGYHAMAVEGNTVNISGGSQFDPTTGVLTGPNGQHIDGLHMDKNGFDTASIAKLKEAGAWQGDTITHSANSVVEMQSAPVNHDTMSQLGKEVHRSWFDNDTSAFDRNELRLDLQTDSNGNVVVDASSMLKGDSFHGGDTATMDFSNYKVLVSASEGTQSTPIELSFDSTGHIVVPQGSVAEQFFSKGPDGSVQFHGAYLEAVQVNAANPDGSLDVQSLATVVGSGDMTQINVPHETVVDSASHLIRIGFPPELGPQEVEAPWFIPVTGRDGLRKQARPRDGQAVVPQPGDGVPPVPPAPDEVRRQTERNPEWFRGGPQSDTRTGADQPRSTTGTSTNGLPRATSTSEVPRATASSSPTDSRSTSSEQSRPEVPITPLDSQANARLNEQQRGLKEVVRDKTVEALAKEHPAYREANSRINEANREADKNAKREARRNATALYKMLARNYQHVFDEKSLAEWPIPESVGDPHVLDKSGYIESDPTVALVSQQAYAAFLEMETIRQTLQGGNLSDADKRRLDRQLAESEDEWRRVEAILSREKQRAGIAWQDAQQGTTDAASRGAEEQQPPATAESSSPAASEEEPEVVAQQEPGQPPAARSEQQSRANSTPPVASQERRRATGSERPAASGDVSPLMKKLQEKLAKRLELQRKYEEWRAKNRELENLIKNDPAYHVVDKRAQDAYRAYQQARARVRAQTGLPELFEQAVKDAARANRLYADAVRERDGARASIRERSRSR